MDGAMEWLFGIVGGSLVLGLGRVLFVLGSLQGEVKQINSRLESLEAVHVSKRGS